MEGRSRGERLDVPRDDGDLDISLPVDRYAIVYVSVMALIRTELGLEMLGGDATRAGKWRISV